MTKKTPFDLDAITAAINGTYQNRDDGISDSVDYKASIPEMERVIEPTTIADAAPASNIDDVPTIRNIEAPLMIIEFKLNAENPETVDSFVLSVEGIPGDAGLFVNYLQSVVDTIKEQNPSISQ